eukprot:TRINITY_DN6214_c0_g2_i1.p2 TRINITY_DN6214_c0_g2~~TRINITY_DN6214_c0_g2_i1.p2  ORF type:complete len:198 (+),score=69.46 TRINITY_DN6214_c0_g2_i1:54-596(+)
MDLPGELCVPSDRAVKVLTLVLVITDDGVLLGRKTRGFGEGRWNGFGGKVEPGESVRAGALRELHEEASIHATDLQHTAVIYFWFDEGEERLLETHLFVATAYDGVPAASEEMSPIEWYPPTALPFDKMWPDDSTWVPHLLAHRGSPFIAKFRFKDVDEAAITHSEITPVSLECLAAIRQ